MSSPFAFDVGDEVLTPNGLVGMIISRTENLFGVITYKVMLPSLEFLDDVRESELSLEAVRRETA